jgi:hypothetical protein
MTVDEVAEAALDTAVRSCSMTVQPGLTMKKAMESRRSILHSTVNWTAVAQAMISLLRPPWPEKELEWLIDYVESAGDGHRDAYNRRVKAIVERLKGYRT